MAKQKLGLGRGLDALISGASDVLAAQQSTQQSAESIPLVPIDSIIPNPRQPRRAFREDDPRLLELSDSIKEHGLIQPIVVTRLDADDSSAARRTADSWLSRHEPPATTTAASAPLYQIIAGERRWRASKIAGLIKVPVVIKEVTPQQMLEMALIENIQRADLNPIEEALAYQSLIQDFNLTQEMVAKQVGKDRSTVTNSLRLLQLAPKVRDALINQSSHFSEGHARTLVGIQSEEDQVRAMEQIISSHLNVRQAEELATRIKNAERNKEDLAQNTKPWRRSPELDTFPRGPDGQGRS